MYKILLAGASTYGVKNMGDDAMLYNLTQKLHEQIDCKITFLARHPSPEYDSLYKIESIKNFEFDNKKESLGKWFNGFNPYDNRENLELIKKYIEECDLIIIGGNSFMEVSENSFMRGVSSYSSLLATFAIFFNKPYVLYGVAGHEIEGKLTQEHARYLCDNSSLVTIRENFYKNKLLDAGADNKNLVVCGDPAWGIKKTNDLSIGKEVLIKEGIIFTNQSIIGIGFRHMYWKWTESEFEIYSQKMAELCDFIIEKINADILFIPNCTYNIDTNLEDDRYIAKFIIEKIKNKKNVHLIKEEMNLIETLAIYEHIDMLVSNRRHSNIFAAVHHKPIFALSSGHSWQFKPFMEDLGLEENYASFTNDTLLSLQNKFLTLWNDRTYTKNKIIKRVALLQDGSNRHINLILKVLKGKESK